MSFLDAFKEQGLFCCKDRSERLQLLHTVELFAVHLDAKLVHLRCYLR